MSACHDVRQVFRYVFRPLGQQKQDGGFSVQLYSDGRFCVQFCDIAGFVVKEDTFNVSLDVITAFERVALINRNWLILKRPILVGKSNYPAACVIEIGEYAPIYAVNLEELTSLPESDSVGFFARRIWILFENASSLLLLCGLYLFPDHFSALMTKSVVSCDGTDRREVD